MNTIYQRGNTQEESLHYEHKKHDGSLPLAGVNTFLRKDHGGDMVTEIELTHLPPEEKGQQIGNADAFRAHCQDDADIVDAHLRYPTSHSALQATARDRKDVFAPLMEAVKAHFLGQINHVPYRVGGDTVATCSRQISHF